MAFPKYYSLAWIPDDEASSYFCKLSNSVASRIQFRGSVAVLHIECTDPEISFYVAWNGSISQSSADNSINLPLLLLEHIRDPQNAPTSALVSQVDSVAFAIEVEIKPASQYDWEVVNAQMDSVERAVLRQLALVDRGGQYRIKLSPSVSVTFFVHRLTLQESDIKNTHGDIALLSVDTLLIVIPPPTPQPPTSSNLPLPSPLPSLIRLASTFYPLRCLPHHTRGLVTSFECTSSNCPEDGSMDEALDLLAKMEGMGGTGMGRCSGPQGNSSSFMHPFVDWANDDATCLVHPLFMLTIAELVCARPPTPSSTCPSTEGHTPFTIPAITDYLSTTRFHAALITLSPSSYAPSTRALTQHLMTRLAASDTVRPYHISLPASLRMAMCIADYDLVTVELLGGIPSSLSVPLSLPIPARGGDFPPHAGPTLRPQRVRLTAVDWISTDSPSTRPPTATSTVSVDAIKSSLIHLCDRCHGPLVISHSSVLTLPHDASYHVDLGWDDNSSIAMPYLVIDDEDKLLELLDVLEVGGDVLVAYLPSSLLGSIRPSTFKPSSESPTLANLHGIAPLLSSILLDMALCFLPESVFTRVKHNTLPPCKLTIVGTTGMGKTAICKGTESLFRTHSQTLCHTEYLDCYPLSLPALNIEKLKAALDAVYASAARKGPALVILDNIDRICPPSGNDGSEGGHVALHLCQLLDKYAEMGAQSDADARAVYALSGGKEGERNDANFASKVVAVATHNLVFTLLTTSTLLHPLLCQVSKSAGKQIPIPIPSNHARREILSYQLQKRGLSFEIGGVHRGGGEESKVDHVLQGLRPGDLEILAVRVAASRHQKQGQLRRKGAVIAVDDVLLAVEGFVPLGVVQAPTQTASWDDIGGLSATRKELEDLFMTPSLFPGLFLQGSIRLPRAALLYGPPGCGKTLVARAIGEQFGLAFLTVHGPALLDKYIGSSEKAVRELFQRASSMGRPALIFFDEFEAIAPRRGKDNSGVTDRVVNQLLTFLDGVEATMGGSEGQVYVLAATSRPDLIDVALLRPGRVERHIYLGLPSRKSTKDILLTALRKLDLSPDVAGVVDDMCEEGVDGLTGADLDSIAKSAFLLAAQEAADGGPQGSKSGEDEGRSAASGTQNSPLEVEMCTSGCKGSAGAVEGAVGDRGVRVCRRHILHAWRATRPSLSPSDMLFYRDIHEKFAGTGIDVASGSGSTSNSVPTTTQRLALM